MDKSVTDTDKNHGAIGHVTDVCDVSNFPSHVNILKPQIDQIFSEVHKNLPTIDFDSSDVSSDGDEPIFFHQNLKLGELTSDLDDDKDLDTSLSQGDEAPSSRSSLEDLQSKVYGKNKNVSASNVTENKDNDEELYDNDLSAFLSKTTFPTANEIKKWQFLAQRMDDTEAEVNMREEADLKRSQKLGHISKVTSVLDTTVPCNTTYTTSGLESRENKESEKINFENQTSDFDNKTIDAVDTESINLDMDTGLNSADHFSEIVHKFHQRLENGLKFMNSTDQRKIFVKQFQNKDEDILTKFTLQEPTTLSLRLFEELDLDSVLTAANEENIHMSSFQVQGPNFSSQTQKSHNGGGDKKTDTDNSEELTLIQKLAQLSALQSGADVKSVRSLDPQTGATMTDGIAISATLPNAEMACQTQGTATSCAGTSTDSGIGKAKILYGRLKHEKRYPEPPTVFIDLRGFERQKKEERKGLENVQRILGIKAGQHKEESSSDDDDEMIERCDWRLTRQKIKQELSVHGASATFLHDKKQADEDPLPKSKHKPPPRVISLQEHTSSKNVFTSSNTNSSAVEMTKNKEEDKKTRMERLDTEKERQRKEAMKLREERDKEQELKMRMSKHIEAGRSLATTQGRQSAGENTPIVFDIDVSYEPAPTTLPTTLPSETLLLTVHLSSNGEIVQHRNRSNRSVDTEEGLSATYIALLSWLLSLVPQESTSQESSPSTTDHTIVPSQIFNVVGLQQLWLEEELRLYVVVAPTETVIGRYSRPRKGKPKDDMKGSSKFAQVVIKFLSVNTLNTVCPWWSNLVPVEVRNEWPEDKNAPQFSYSPPLPTISTKPLSTFVQVNPDPLVVSKIFNIPVGFVWQTVDNDEGWCQDGSLDDDICYETQNAMSLIYKNIFHNPISLMALLSRVSQEGLDLAGIRLLYPCPELLKSQTLGVSPPSDHDVQNDVGPVLALALRGRFARTIWLDAVGPSDPHLARRTDPNSLCALFGGDHRDNVLLFCPRNPERIQSELTRWFGGRIPKGATSVHVGSPHVKKVEGRGKRGKKSNTTSDCKYMTVEHPPAALTATCKADIFLVLSPLVPASFFGALMATSQRRGYQIKGVKRLLLTSKLAGSLGINTNRHQFFCPGVLNNELCKDRPAEAIAPSTIFLLCKENAAHNMQSLIEAFMIQLTMAGRLGCVQMRISESLTSKHLFHTALYTGSLLTLLGGNFSKVPEFDLSHLRLNSSISESACKNLEQIAVVLLLGHDLLKMCGMFIAQILDVLPYSKTPVQAVMTERFELLGIKRISKLSMHQAKEVTPYEVGDKLWRQSVHLLTSEPALVLVLRGVNIFNILKPVVKQQQQAGGAAVKAGQDREALLLKLKEQRIVCMMSHNPRESDVFTRLFFCENELYPDPLARNLLPYLPESKLYFNILEMKEAGHTVRTFSLKPLGELNLTQENIMEEMVNGQQTITTVLLIKPRVVQKYLQKILRKIVQEQFGIVGLQLLMLSSEMVDSFIPLSQKKDNTTHQKHIDALTSGPALAMALQQQNAVKRLCDLIGPEDPVSARCQSQFLWRGEFGSDFCNNGLYCSTSYVDAVRDLKLLFPDGVCCGVSDLLTVEEIYTPAEDSIIDINANVTRIVTLTSQTHQNSQPYEVKVEDIHHLLLQTTCVILTPPLMKMNTRTKTVHGVDLLTVFLNNGFAVVGARLVWLTKKQAECLLCLVGGDTFEQVTFLCSGPCLVLAMERENAVVAFESILSQQEESQLLMKEYGDLIIHPSSIKQAAMAGRHRTSDASRTVSLLGADIAHRQPQQRALRQATIAPRLPGWKLVVA